MTPEISNKTSYRMESIQVILSVNDIEVSREFYVNVLGFTEVEWGNNRFTGFNKDGYGIYLCKGGQGTSGQWVWMGFDGDIDDLHTHLKAKGATIRQAPMNFSWAFEMHVEDPDGHILRFGTEPLHHEEFHDKEMKNSY